MKCKVISRRINTKVKVELFTHHFLLYKHQWDTTSELSRINFISSHVKRSPLLWLHNKSRLWKQADLVFHWYRCLYSKQNITYSLMDMNFIFSCSTRYLTSESSERVRYWVDHSKIKFLFTRGHVISSMYLAMISCNLFVSCYYDDLWKRLFPVIITAIKIRRLITQN